MGGYCAVCPNHIELHAATEVSARGKITYKLGQYPRSFEWEEMKEHKDEDDDEDEDEEEQKQQQPEVKGTKRKLAKSLKEELKSAKKQCRN
ncbi:nucleolin-like [Drosophila guanche]|uniref:nucleolin-like n=1 Tax=Drosophila guanche TaxID=7266 RepID=UPI00147191C0|nr:nucleolin-like [Drosophila guanche]